MKLFSKGWVFFTRLRVISAGCVLSLLLTLVFDGSLVAIYKLSQREKNLVSKIKEIRAKTEALQARVKSAKHPLALARQARNRFDMVGKDDLIFVFTD